MTPQPHVETTTRQTRWLDASWRWLPAAGALLVLGGAAGLRGDVCSWWGFAAVACAVSYAVRDRWPVWALVVALVLVAAIRLPGVEVLSGQVDVVYLLVLFVPVLPLVAVASTISPRWSWIALIATVLVTVAVCPDPAWSTVDYAGRALAVAWALTVGVPLALALVAWLAGSALLSRQLHAVALSERAASLERTHVAEGEAAVAAERVRIARELHDVITHTVAVMVVQAAAADAVWDRDPARARQALQVVEHSGRTAMAELRGFVGAMRDEVPLQAPAGVEALPALAAQVRDSGLAADLTVTGPVSDITALTGASLLRVAQESVTNALRHAHASRITINLDVQDDEVRLSIADDGVGAGAATGGWGIVGMRERVAVLEGTFAIAAGGAGGTVVAVHVPLRGEA